MLRDLLFVLTTAGLDRLSQVNFASSLSDASIDRPFYQTEIAQWARKQRLKPGTPISPHHHRSSSPRRTRNSAKSFRISSPYPSPYPHGQLELLISTCQVDSCSSSPNAAKLLRSSGRFQGGSLARKLECLTSQCLHHFWSDFWRFCQCQALTIHR